MNEAVVTSPLWAEIVTAALVIIGAAFAAIGSFGLLRMPTFYRRIHTPTLGATLGAWAITLATIVFFSTQGLGLFLHAALISFFVALTAPVTTIFVMRVALFRDPPQARPRRTGAASVECNAGQSRQPGALAARTCLRKSRRMNLTLRQLRAFIAVADHGSFTEAARKLHLTQAAMSVLVRDLEAELGARVLDRHTRTRRTLRSRARALSACAARAA